MLGKRRSYLSACVLSFLAFALLAYALIIYSNVSISIPTCNYEGAAASVSGDGATAHVDHQTGDILRNMYKDYEAKPIERKSCKAWTDPLFKEITAKYPVPYFHEILARYMEFHRQSMKRVDWTKFLADKSSLPEDLRFLIVEYAFGNGNNMISLSSAFIAALMTKRVLLVNGGIPADEMFCEVVPGSYVDIKSDVVDSIKSSKVLWHDMVSQYSSNTDPFQTVYIDMYHDKANENDAVFFNPTGLSRMSRSRFVYIRSNQFFLLGFYAHPLYGPVLKMLFPDNLPHTHILTNLMIPKDPQWHGVKLNVDYLRQNRPILGIQLRYFTDQPQEIVHTLLNECFDILKREKVIDGSNLKKTSLFVASLLNVRSFFEKMGFAVFVQNTEDQTQSISIDQAYSSLIEMYTFAYTDIVVTSSHSTFGYQATSFHPNSLPWHMNTMKQRQVACWRGTSSQPCFQYRGLNIWTLTGKELQDYGLIPCGDWDGTGATLKP